MALLTAKTENGIIEGLPAENQAISVFKGVPFAAPPVGELRWKAPQPVENWEGVYKAYTYSAIPMQHRVAKGSFYQKEFYPVELPRSEDCLYLNIWTPAESADEKLPVSFWIFGGGMRQGYGHKMETDGEAFAKRGIVHVSINYRVGIFGFMAHPELTEESGCGASGNYGIMDQIAALKWVRRNIAAFGGDPDRITIFGQSAGGRSVQTLVASPLTKGDIHQAIMESGGGMNINAAGDQIGLAQAEDIGAKFTEFLGGGIGEARALSADELFDRFEEFSAHYPQARRLGLITDGYVLPQAAVYQFRDGQHPDIQYMVGCTADESTRIPNGAPGGRQQTDIEQFEAEAKRNYGEYAEKYIEAAGVKTPEEIAYFKSMNQKYGLHSGVMAFGELQNMQGRKPAYTYYFANTPPGEPDAGAFHSSEHMYIFQTFLRSWRPYTGRDFDFSIQMCSYWTNFVKYGDPNGEGLPVWTPYTEENPKSMKLDAVTGCEMIDPPAPPIVRFLKDYSLGKA